MGFGLFLLGAVSLAGQSLAQSSVQPCEAVRSASAAWNSAYPEATGTYVYANDAQACLASVPLDTAGNKEMLQQLALYYEWQSNIEYLKNPPQGYTGNTVDVMGELNKLSESLDNGDYTNEFDFQADLYLMLQEAGDFHLVFISDILQVFLFTRGGLASEGPFALTSVSTDGQSLPGLYNYYDILQINQGATFTPSTVVEINNQSADTYINNWAKQNSFIDIDARYNQLFPNQAAQSMGQDANGFATALIPDGPTTTVTYANQSTVTYTNYALLLQDFSQIDSGDDIWTYFLNQGPPQSKKKREEKRAAPIATGYPQPVVLHSEGVVGGYYLSDEGYDDTAVLSIPSFSPASDNGATEFQDTVATFLKDAVSAGKKKLIVDLRYNGGGLIFLGYDTFKQLFPSMLPWGTSRFRATDIFNTMGVLTTDFLAPFTEDQAIQDAQDNTYNGSLAAEWQDIFNYKNFNTSDETKFSSWQDLFGPHTFNGDNFTSLTRYNLGDFFGDAPNFDVSGYGTRANSLGAQPFDAANIVILQDGACGSTCAIFSELMKTQGNVQQVVMGGTPKTGPMQGVSGSKGAQDWGLDLINNHAVNGYNYVVDNQVAIDTSSLEQLANATRPLFRAAYDSQSGEIKANINLRDNIRMGDEEGQTPLEFIFEAADCKLWYTAPMLSDVTATWKAAADARWSNNKGCVEGSVGDKSSISGGFSVQNSASNGTGNSTSNGHKKGSAPAGATTGLTTLILAVAASMMMAIL